jgi:hypothetical protein
MSNRRGIDADGFADSLDYTERSPKIGGWRSNINQLYCYLNLGWQNTRRTMNRSLRQRFPSPF